MDMSVLIPVVISAGIVIVILLSCVLFIKLSKMFLSRN